MNNIKKQYYINNFLASFEDIERLYRDSLTSKTNPIKRILFYKNIINIITY